MSCERTVHTCRFKGSLPWSSVPEINLLPRYPSQVNFTLISFQWEINSTVYVRIANPSWMAKQPVNSGQQFEPLQDLLEDLLRANGGRKGYFVGNIKLTYTDISVFGWNNIFFN